MIMHIHTLNVALRYWGWTQHAGVARYLLGYRRVVWMLQQR